MSKKADLSSRDILKRPYARILIPEEDGTYSAEVLEFPGCYSEGDTAAEAIHNLEEAAVSWIEATLEQNKVIPEPLATYEYSGKINLRLPKSIHKQAARFAQKEDVSLNQYFASAIAARVGAEELYDHLVKKLEGRLTPFVSAALFQQNISCIMFTADSSGSLLGPTYVTALSPWMVRAVATPKVDVVPIPTIAAK